MVKASLWPVVSLFSAIAVAEAQPEREEIVIKNGYLITMQTGAQDRPDSDILIRNGRIVAIGQGIKADRAKVIDAQGKFVLPGFVDVHSHLYVSTMRGQFRNTREGKFFPVSNRLAAVMQPDDIYTAMYTGALELLNGGITSTGDFFDAIRGPAWAEAGRKALQDSGIRAVMYYGGPDKTTRLPIDTAHLLTLAGQQHPRVSLGLAWRLPRDLSDEQNWAQREAEFNVAQQHQLPVQVHVSGDARAMFNALIDRRHLNPSVTVVHASDATPAQLAALNHTGASLALTPLSEQRVAYGLTRLDHYQSVRRQGLGIDGTSLAGRGDMFATLRLAALTLSGARRDETAADPRQLLSLATLRGAATLGLEEVTGSLEAGKRADLQIIDPASLSMSGYGGGDPAALIVYSAGPENVETVLVEGRVIKEAGRLVGVDEKQWITRASRSAAGLLQRAEAAAD